MKKIILIAFMLICVSSVSGETCKDFSERMIHELEFEYGRYPPPCPECEDPKYHVGKEHYVLKDKAGYPKPFAEVVSNPYGYLGESGDYWDYYERAESSLVPHEGAVRYTEYMGVGSMTITDGASLIATQNQFLDAFIADEKCKPGYVEPVVQEEIPEPELYEEPEQEDEPDVIEDEIIEGCMDRDAINYNPKANRDMPCEYEECPPGLRFNYATKECEYPCLEFQLWVADNPDDKVGRCVPKCSGKNVWDSELGVCLLWNETEKKECDWAQKFFFGCKEHNITKERGVIVYKKGRVLIERGIDIIPGSVGSIVEAGDTVIVEEGAEVKLYFHDGHYQKINYKKKFTIPKSVQTEEYMSEVGLFFGGLYQKLKKLLKGEEEIISPSDGPTATAGVRG